jgi:23S rRNA pseudouridine2457 synthase
MDCEWVAPNSEAATMLIAFNKPYGVVARFTAENANQPTLAGYGFPPHVYPLGRLDADSEGLLLLTDDPGLNERLLHPRHRHPRCYYAQVERIPTLTALQQLEQGVLIQGHRTLPCRAWILAPPPAIPPREPPIRYRKTVPDCWIALELCEGKNRQVRHMTAAIGHPTLRLVRVSIGRFQLGTLPLGRWQVLSEAERAQVMAKTLRHAS